jgi:dCTP deaminase
MTTLSDTEIAIEMAAGRLIKCGDEAQVNGACYELRLGSVYYDLSEGDHPIQLQPGEKIIVKPGHRVVLITHEEMLVPEDMLVRVVSKGSLFSVGLSPVATYADPGFTGNLGVVTQNISNKYIVLPILEPIAKADFTKLTGPVMHPYRGQHGFRTEIWPIKHQLQKEHAEVAGDRRVKSQKEEAYALLPRATQQLLRSLEFRQRLTDIAIVVAVMLNALVLFLITNKLIDNVVGLGGNLLASAIVGMVVFYAKLSNRRA